MAHVRLWWIVLAGCGATGPSMLDSDTEVLDTEVLDTEVVVIEPTCDVLDCDDPACADRFECTWPEAQAHRSEITFSGRTIDCRFFGVAVPYDVGDCATSLRALLSVRTSGDLCEVCDLTFEGDLEYVSDTCQELLGGGDLLAVGSWGYRFIDDTTRELFLPNKQGVWTSEGEIAADEEGVFHVSYLQEVRENPPDCGNGQQHLGDLSIESTFRDRAAPPE